MLRPTYSAISQHACDGKPALVFVPTRRHAKMAALDLLTHAAADGAPHKFRQAGEADIAAYLDRVTDPALKHSLAYGVAFLHETQSAEEQAVARLLFDSGAVQVLVATAPMCWGMTSAAHLVVVMGTQVGPAGMGWACVGGAGGGCWAGSGGSATAASCTRPAALGAAHASPSPPASPTPSLVLRCNGPGHQRLPGDRPAADDGARLPPPARRAGHVRAVGGEGCRGAATAAAAARGAWSAPPGPPLTRRPVPLPRVPCSCVLMCHSPRKEYYKKFLFEPLPGTGRGSWWLCGRECRCLLVQRPA